MEGNEYVNTVTSSERSTSLDCSRRWYWNYGLKLVPTSKPIYWSFGSLWHQILEEYYLGIEEHGILNITGLVSKAKDIAGEWLDFHSVKSDLDQEKFEQVKALAEIVPSMVFGYAKTWLNNDLCWNIVGIEETLVSKLRTASGRKSTKNRYAGAYDLLVEKDGEYILVEHKTTAGKAHAIEPSLAVNPQALGYLWLARKVSTAACDTTPDIFRNALIENNQDPEDPAYQERLQKIESNQSGNWFHRFYRYVSKDDLKEFQIEASVDATSISRMRRLASRENQASFSRNWNSCMSPGRSCPYVDLCCAYNAATDNEEFEDASVLGFSRKQKTHSELLEAFDGKGIVLV